MKRTETIPNKANVYIYACDSFSVEERILLRASLLPKLSLFVGSSWAN